MSERDPAVSEHPTVVGPYHIVHLVGEGGMGVVYAAEQLYPVRRRVALKMMKPGMGSREVVARFEAERHTLAVMDHPGIARVLDAGVSEDGRPFSVMELVRGVRIDEYCDRFRLTVRERVELFIQLCQAVQHAHQKGVIHRDLKPSNVLVAEQDGVAIPKVIDFGVAKATGHHLSDSPGLTSLGVAMGTLAYMSPEQAEGDQLDVDTRADIYSLSVMLCEVLVGRVPVDPHETGVPRFLARLVSRDVMVPLPRARLDADGGIDRLAGARGTTPKALRKALEGDLQWVVMKAVEKDRARRYESANGLAMDLRRVLDDEPVVAHAPSAAYRLGKLVRRHGSAAAARAQAQAEVQARTARRVADFLVDLFEVNDPGQAQGSTVTAREILDRGARRVEQELKDEPVVQARMLAAMGTVYQGPGLYEDALPLLGRALTLREEALPPGSPEIAESLRRLGVLQRNRGDLEAWEEGLRRALSLQEAALEPGDEELAHALHAPGATVLARGRAEEADTLLRRALSIEEGLLGADQDMVAFIVTHASPGPGRGTDAGFIQGVPAGVGPRLELSPIPRGGGNGGAGGSDPGSRGAPQLLLRAGGDGSPTSRTPRPHKAVRPCGVSSSSRERATRFELATLSLGSSRGAPVRWGSFSNHAGFRVSSDGVQR